MISLVILGRMTFKTINMRLIILRVMMMTMMTMMRSICKITTISKGAKRAASKATVTLRKGRVIEEAAINKKMMLMVLFIMEREIKDIRR